MSSFEDTSDEGMPQENLLAAATPVRVRRSSVVWIEGHNDSGAIGEDPGDVDDRSVTELKPKNIELLGSEPRFSERRFG